MIDGGIDMNYTKAIKDLREKLLISQDELANLLDVSIQTVNRWENGKHEPTIKAKRKLKKLFDDNKINLEED